LLCERSFAGQEASLTLHREPDSTLYCENDRPQECLKLWQFARL